MFSLKTTTNYVVMSLLAASVLTATSCKKDDEDPTPDSEPSYSIPSTYEFSRDGESSVSYSGQTDRLAMFAELSAYGKGATGGAVTATKLNAYFTAADNAFDDADLNASSKQLSNKTAEPDFITDLFDDLETVSASYSATAGENKAGLLTTGEKKYLVDANGVEIIQVIEKGMIGALCYSQIVDGYLTDEKTGKDVENTELEEGKTYTAREHHWDEAFGYWGVPTDFPTATDDIKFLGKYTNTVDEALGSNQKIMDAFLAGRAAIVNKDETTIDASKATITKELERVIAGAAVHYLIDATSNFDDDAKRSHQLSEAIGFIYGLKFGNADTRIISTTKWTEVRGLLSEDTDLWDISKADIAAVQAKLVAVYGFTAAELAKL